MRRVALTVVAVTLVAGCGGSKHAAVPTNALLTDVHVGGKSVTFDFKSAPVPLKGKAYVVIHFAPAASADIQGEQVIPTYTGAKRLSGPGPVLETARTSDFEADLAWAIGLERRMTMRVARDGTTVTVTFG